MPQPMDVDAAPAPFAAPEASPVSFIPAALQPVGFDDFDDEDEDEDEGLPPLDLTSALGRIPRAFAVPTPAPVLARVAQSDEGGRFYLDVSEYRLLLVEPEQGVEVAPGLVDQHIAGTGLEQEVAGEAPGGAEHAADLAATVM